MKTELPPAKVQQKPAAMSAVDTVVTVAAATDSSGSDTLAVEDLQDSTDADDTTAVAEADSTEDAEIIAQKLEEARQLYLSALTAQEAGDSTACQDGFEKAIDILNEISYYPEIARILPISARASSRITRSTFSRSTSLGRTPRSLRCAKN